MLNAMMTAADVFYQRTNIGNAKVAGMTDDLGMSEEIQMYSPALFR